MIRKVTTVAIADDHPIVLSGLRSLIDADAGFAVIAAAANGALVLQAIRAQHPDIAVLDVNMPALSGIQVLAAIKRERLSTRVVLIAATASDVEIYDAVAIGAAGMILKEAAPETLMDCLHFVAGGGTWLPADLVDSAVAREARRREGWQRLSPSLTTRELEIVELVVSGASNKEIAFQLNVSDGTIKVHLNNIFRKLRVPSRADLRYLVGGRLEAVQPLAGDGK